MKFARLAYETIKGRLVFSDNCIVRLMDLGAAKDKPLVNSIVQALPFKDSSQKTMYRFKEGLVHQYLAAFYLAKNVRIVQSFEECCPVWDQKFYSLWKFYSSIMKGNCFPLKELYTGENRSGTRMLHSLSSSHPGTFMQLMICGTKQVKLYPILQEAPKSYAFLSLTQAGVIRKGYINLKDLKLMTLKDIHMLATFLTKKSCAKDWKVLNLINCNISISALIVPYEKPTIEVVNISRNTISQFGMIAWLVTAFQPTEVYATNMLCRFNSEVIENFHVHNYTLQKLDLSLNYLTTEDIIRFYDILLLFKGIKHFCLNKNFIDDKAKEILIALMVQWSGFQELECEENRFTQDTLNLFQSAKKLFGLDYRSLISALNFNKNYNHIDNFIKIFESIRIVTTDHCVFVKNLSTINHLSLECADEEENDLTLSLFLSEHACEAFTIFKNLKKLNLSGIQVNYEAAGVLVKNNRLIDTLEVLIVNNCGLTSHSLTQILRRLQDAKCIT